MDSLRVAVRIRPERTEDNCVVVTDESVISVMKSKDMMASASSSADNNTTFKFDKIFNECSSQSDVFEYAKPLIDECLQGFTVTIFAFG